MAVDTRKDKASEDSGGEIKTPGPDNPANFNEHTKTIFNNQTLDQKAPSITETEYAEPPHVSDDDGKTLSDVRDKFAPNAEKPTTASGSSSLNLPEILKVVDSSGLSSLLPNMLGSLSKTRDTMNSTVQAARKPTLEAALTGALCNLSKTYSFEQVMEVFNSALLSGGYLYILPVYQSVVQNSLVNLINLAIEYGPKNIPVNEYPKVVYGSKVPTPVVTTVPDLYIRQYYSSSEDPYPGYIHYKSQDGKTSVYVKRKETDYPVVSCDEDLIMIAEREMTEYFDPYVKAKNLNGVAINNEMLLQDAAVESNGMDRNLGQNSGPNNSNSSDVLGQLMGALGQVVSKVQSTHLPNSVLNQSNVNKALDEFNKNMGTIKKMQSDTLTAFDPKTSFGSLGSISSVQSSLSKVNVSASGISNIKSILTTLGKT